MLSGHALDSQGLVSFSIDAGRMLANGEEPERGAGGAHVALPHGEEAQHAPGDAFGDLLAVFRLLHEFPVAGVA